ncbi:MAG TPA: hypothetical protein VKA10_05680 [Prolixibacteraceae bacterium]|nr:hypothetical protein [Prolixibacteraceae bacterium]
MESKFDLYQWRSIRDNLQNKYPELTNADLVWGRTTRDDMLQMISAKLGKTKRDLLDVIDSFEFSA